MLECVLVGPPTDLGPFPHARCVHQAVLLPVLPLQVGVHRVAGCACQVTDHRPLGPHQRVQDAALPHVGASDNAHFDAPGRGVHLRARGLTGLGELGDQEVQDVPDAVAVLGGDGGGLHAVRPELGRVQCGLRRLTLVDCQVLGHTGLGLLEPCDDLLVGGVGAFLAVHNHDDGVRFPDGHRRLALNVVWQVPSAIARQAVFDPLILHVRQVGQPPCVDNHELLAPPVPTAVHPVPRDAGGVVNNGLGGPREAVEQLRLANVRPPHKGNLRQTLVWNHSFFGHLQLCFAVQLEGLLIIPIATLHSVLWGHPHICILVVKGVLPQE
mmetsp:Transcript_66794/g.118508  ORF Transcript_66794/g.118508 Transcript_66794/m.118508 type:complete len:325 (-) Transcript_66794:647-1621(-)